VILKKLYDSIQRTLSKKNINVVVGNIYDMMAVWKSWYRGNVNDFHYYSVKLADGKTCEKERRTMNMPKKVCEDFSKLEWSEKVEIKLDNEESTEKLLKVLNSKENNFNINFPSFLEKEYALGTAVTVEYRENGKTIIDYIEGDVVLPYKYTNSYIYGLVTVSRIVEGPKSKRKYYTHLTYHEFEDNTYSKINELYVSSNENTLGKEIPFSDKFPEVEEYEVIETEHPRFQVWKLPIANNFDTGSPMGLSILANQIDKFKSIDTKYDSFDHEFVSGKRRILVDRKAVKKEIEGMDDNNNIIYTSYFDATDDVYVAIKGMEDQPIKDINFDLRTEQHIKAINTELNYLSAGVGLGTGFYEFDGKGLKTATEVVSENSDTYRTKVHHQIPIYDCLYDLIATICEMEGIGYKEISITFDDSIVQDEDALIKRGIELYNASLISKEKFMKKYLHYEDTEVSEELLKIQEDNKIVQPEGLDFFGMDDSNNDSVKIEPGHVEDVVSKSLNGAQTQSLINTISQYKQGVLTYNQAVQMLKTAIGITKEEAEELLKE